jgi:hypothetical protein
MTTAIFALIGSKALLLTYSWLASAIVAAYLSHRKGYGERPGLACGLLLNFVGIIVWLVYPARDESLWKTVGPFGSMVKSEKAAMEKTGGGTPPSDAPKTAA